MSGKVIIYAPTMSMGLAKATIFLNGSEVAKLKRNEKVELDLSRDGYVQAKIALNPASEKVPVKANVITEIRMSYNQLTWKPLLQIVREQSVEQAKAAPVQIQEIVQEKPAYDLVGSRGRYIKVYEDKCVIGVKAGLGSLVTGNATDGEKTIYYSDVLGVQFKKSGAMLGYLQLETASAIMNNRTDNLFNENSFTFEGHLDNIMEEVQLFVKKKVDEAKRQKNAPVVVAGTLSNADELKKFKELLDMGIITQEEFDAKKKQLLGL